MTFTTTPFIILLYYLIIKSHAFHPNTRNQRIPTTLFLKNEQQQHQQQQEGIRLNKIFQKTHSRREADTLITSGRVTVNGASVAEAPGVRVTSEDRIELDGERIHSPLLFQETQYEYIKYWKPVGVICTTDRKIPGNILDALESSTSSSSGGGGEQHLPKSRIFPCGRLDKDTSGLILLTSDGRLPNSILRGKQKIPKTYIIKVEHTLTPEVITKLQKGVIITTQAQRDGKRPPPLTARTLPCKAKLIDPTTLVLQIVEGRNRQIRKMLGNVGYTVVKLHRCGFGGMDLGGLSVGEWMRLSEDEVGWIEDAITRATEED